MRRRFCPVMQFGVCASVCCLLAGSVAADSLKVLQFPAGVPQLFVDDELIESHDGLERRLHSPVKDKDGSEPLIAAKPGTTLLAYGSIVFDERLQRYVMFTQDFPQRRMHRFTSADGLAWDTGQDGTFEKITFGPSPQQEPGTRGGPGIDLFSCCYDKSDPAWPYKGWLYYANYGNEREGIYYVRSADGRLWERGGMVVNAWAGPGDPSSNQIEQNGKVVFGPGDVTLFSPDPQTGRFLGLFKFFTTSKLYPGGNNLRSRAYAYFNRLDEPFDTSRLSCVALLPAAEQSGGDEPADEYYASTAWRYGPVWLGGLKIWHSRDDYPHSAAGCAFLKLAVSRDGLHWQKVGFRNEVGVPEVFLANGPEGGNSGRNDGGYISEFSQGPLRIGNELVYYYSASSWGKNAPSDKRLMGGGIFRARLRPDGFVSVTAGTLVTKPFQPATGDLVINATGPLRVTLLNARDRKLGAATVQGDALEHRVRFIGHTVGQLSGGSPIKLKFEVSAPGQLYSFAFTE